MLKKALLITTALVLCVSASYAVQKPERPDERLLAHLRTFGIPVHVVHGYPVTVMAKGKAGQPQRPHAPEHFARGVTYNTLDAHDANAKFVSWYGFTAAKMSSCYSSSTAHSCITISGTNAIPITGLGYKARKISVPLASPYQSAEFNVGIYSATASGLPGSELAGASTTASNTMYCCTGLRTVKIDIKLKAGQEYFVGVGCGQNAGPCQGAWDMESLDWSGDQLDYFHYKERVTYNSGTGTYTSSFSSPWHKSNYLPANPAAKVY